MSIDTPLKIAVWHNLPSGGGRRALHAHISGLQKRWHQIEIWCPERLDDHFLPLGELAPEHVVPIPHTPPKGTLSETFEVLRGSRSDVLAMDRHCQRCADEITAGNFDVLFSNASRNFAVTAIGRLVDLPSVLYLGEPLRELYEAAPHLPWRTPETTSGALRQALRVRKLGILVREEQKNARAFDRILVNSVFSRESVLRAYGLEASVCYLGVDTSRFRDLGLARENLTIGVGAVVRPKAIERAVEAVAGIGGDRPKLLWIGNLCDQDYRRHLEDLATRLGVDLEIKIDVSETELIEDLNRASVMIYTPRLEPFGYAPLEAAACGLPVVGVREGGVRETVVDGRTGVLTDNQPGQLAAALEQILRDPDLRNRLGADGRRWINAEWTVDHLTDRLERQLADVVRRRRQGPMP